MIEVVKKGCDKVEFKEETIRSKSIYKGNITEYIIEDVRLPDGKEAKREIVRHDGAAAVIAFDEEDRMLFVKQYRKAIDQLSIEIPAGIMDAEDKDGLETAKRELEEETGYQAVEWSFVTSFYSTPGFTDEYLEIYQAKKLIRVENPLAQDEDENIELLPLTFEEAWGEYEKGLLRDSKSVLALFYWKMKKLEEKLKG
jgi:ADP-ribose pyrophosphatase